MEMVISIFGAIGGLSALIMFFIFIKQNKRIKSNEADRGEIDNLRTIIEELERDRDSMKKEIESLKRAYGLSETEKIEIEAKNNKYQRAFNCQDLCDTKPTDCPILVKYNILNK